MPPKRIKLAGPPEGAANHPALGVPADTGDLGQESGAAGGCYSQDSQGVRYSTGFTPPGSGALEICAKITTRHLGHI